MTQLKVEIVPVTPLQQNCTLLWDAATRQAAVVDPGGDAPLILAAITRLDLAVGEIWLTHGHLDHAGGAEALRHGLGGKVPIIGPDRSDAFLLSGIEAQAAAYGLTGFRNAAPDRWLAEGERVAIGPHVFDVLHCPGHTPGHVVFVNTAARFAQLGDVLFRGSIGRTDFPYGDHTALIGAIKTKLLPLGDDMGFVCGHGPSSTIGAERRANPFLR